ncbi:GAF domain-containing protein [Streptomyces sp. CZ24]|nr:SpoIIE family protein phosphatase [Streptomyces sp. CZ24]MBL0803050.1 SpoIIE family protein phosphatase [Streptomyces albidoflavus]MDH6192602.1 GAF domain-containing protein [Streptomyces sp. CZ24]
MVEPGTDVPARAEAPFDGWAAWLHRLWRVGTDADDITALASLVYEALLDDPGVTVVAGARWERGRSSYVRHRGRGGTEVTTLPGCDHTEGPCAPPPLDDGPTLLLIRPDDPEMLLPCPGGRALRDAGAAVVVRCVFELGDGDRAALWVGAGREPGAPWVARTGERLRQIADVLTVSNQRILESRQHERRQAMDAFLAEASLQMAESLDVEETLRRVARMAVPAVAEGCMVHLADSRGTLSAVAVAHMASDAQARLREVAEDDPWLAKELLRGAERRHGLVLTGEDLEGGPFGPGAPGPPVRAMSVSPLAARNRALGTLTFLYSRDSADADRWLLTDLAGRAALAIDTSTLYEQRRRHVEELQRHLLPPGLPDCPGLELSAAYQVADDSLDVGGDFYDAVRVGDRLAVFIGDVCGRGAEAAAYTGLARHTLRTLLENGTSPTAALARLNGALIAQRASRFVTALVAVLTPRGEGAWRVRVANAGHPLPHVARAGGEVSAVPAQGMLLGVVEQVAYRAVSLTLGPGDALVLHTDGLSEARAADGSFFEDRLPEAVARCVGENGGGADGLIGQAARFRVSGDDDTAVVIVQVEGER